MIRKIGILILLWTACGASAQERIVLPALKAEYPRMVNGERCRNGIEELLATPSGAQAMAGIRDRIEPFVARHATDPEWIVSRLQMYWDSHATDVYIDGEVLDHVSGRAPVPTVRYTASRATQTPYRRPALADIRPYQDSLGMWMQNTTAEGQPWEWADPRKTGRNVESMNIEIMNLARDAAFLYWWLGDERCARFAADIFDTYMTGLYYRNVPIDMNHGHQQTLVGLTSFEVIHEDIVYPATETYDFLHDYLVRTHAPKIAIYDAAFKKWADTIIAGGVPHNNWNLLQAQYIFRIALILDDDAAYIDGWGRTHYLDQVLNDSSIRQWSLPKLIGYGFDPASGLWKECPGYATMVVSEFTDFMRLIDRTLGIDLVAAHPVLARAVRNIPQYLFPNGLSVGWGDSHYSRPRTDFYPHLIANARRYGKPEQERLFTAMYRCFDPEAAGAREPDGRISPKVASFTSMKPLVLDPAVPAGRVEEYVTPTFWAEGVSWFAARSGMDADTSLMMSVCGSDGNHMHANGISMELYGKGYVQAPDLGRGSGYTTLDYQEFYSQFPAHNTVCVDGISSYPVMKSCHPIRLEGCYPASEKRDGNYEGVLYGDFSFLEPETQSDQRRTLAIVNTDPAHGYYVDIFRSRRRDGLDKMHDYFYHNIGQEFTLDADTYPTKELSFAGGHLYAYSYLWDKSTARTARDIAGCFTMLMPDSSRNGMRFWMRGERDRKVFKALSPRIYSLSRTSMPYDAEHAPCQTFVARQYGEAWTRPFVAVYEPYDSGEGEGIDSVGFFDCEVVGIRVAKHSGRTDYIFSSDRPVPASYEGMTCCAVLGVVSDDQLFMARGTELAVPGLRIDCKYAATVVVVRRNDGWYYTADAPCSIRIGNKTRKLPAAELTRIE